MRTIRADTDQNPDGLNEPVLFIRLKRKGQNVFNTGYRRTFQKAGICQINRPDPLGLCGDHGLTEKTDESAESEFK